MIQSNAIVRDAPTTAERPADGSHVATVTALDHVAVGTVDMDAAIAFYRDVWGLLPRSAGRDGAVALVGANPAGASLVLLPSNRDALHHVAFRARSLADDGPSLPLVCGERPGTCQRVLADPDGRTIELVAVDGDDEDGAPGGGADPSGFDRAEGARGTDDHGAAPAMGHVVLASPNLEASEAFYRDQLGFRATDRTARGMVFLRCNADHHSLAIASTASAGVQHVAYDVGSIDQLMQNMARLRDLGVPCIWGPGRHGPGHNVFAYYRDPLGCLVEQFADMERVDPEVLVEERWWGPDWPGDLWGLAGPPSREFLDSVLALGSAK